MLRRVFAFTAAALTAVALYASMWILPEVAEGLFFIMLIAPGGVWMAVMEGA
jgi:hypothetical protein